MNRKLTLLLTLVLLLSACGSKAPPPAPTASGTGPTPAGPTPAANAAPTDVPAANRTATITEMTGQVEAHASTSDTFAPASLGTTLAVGGETRTGEDGKARLDLAPEGTIIRVVRNSSFTLVDLSSDNANPKSKIKLFFGQVFIILKGGSLEVETPSGVASVLGSLLGISYDPATKKVTATCLEGHCSLSNEEGTIELEDGEAADIVDGDLSDEARLMTEEELGDWVDENPDLGEYIDEMPDVATEEPVATEPPATEAPIATDPPVIE